MIVAVSAPNRRGLLAMVPGLAAVSPASASGVEVRLSELCREYDALVGRLCAAEDARDSITFGTAPHSKASQAQAAVLSAEVDRLHAAMNAVEAAVGELRATTAGAVRVKAQFWKRRMDSCDLAADPVLRGLIRDLCGEQAA
jgi:hypothetical protein